MVVYGTRVLDLYSAGFDTSVWFPLSSPSFRHSNDFKRPQRRPSPHSSVMSMAQVYPRLDVSSRYGERAMDAKIVVMGNTFVHRSANLPMARERAALLIDNYSAR